MRKSKWVVFMFSVKSVYSTNTYWEDGEKEVRLGMGLEDGRRVAGIGKRVGELEREDGIRRQTEG